MKQEIGEEQQREIMNGVGREKKNKGKKDREVEYGKRKTEEEME
jgi:hypothetical protein